MPPVCQLESHQILTQVEQWVEETVTSYREQCQDVEDRFEAWENQWQYRCSEVVAQTCSGWPWPLNYVCQWVTTLVCGMVLVAMRVVRVVVRVVCQVVTEVIRALVRIVAVVVVPIVVLVCSVLERLPGFGVRTDALLDLSGVNFDRRDGDRVETFLWGVATAGQQVEGQPLRSDWAFFVNDPGITARSMKIAAEGGETVSYTNPSRAIDHAALVTFRADVLRAKALGCNAYRLSIEWARVQPSRPAWVDGAIADNVVPPGAIYRFTDTLTERADGLMPDASRAEHFDLDGLAIYEAMIQALVEEGLQPVVTLNHMSLPRWVCTPPKQSVFVTLAGQGALECGDANDPDYQASLRGWASPLTVAAYEAYVRFVVGRLKELVRVWVTVNEPVGSVAEVGNMAGVWPPGFMADTNRTLTAIHLQIAAHVAAYDAIKAISPQAMVGFAHAVGEVAIAPQTLLQRWFVGDNRAARNQWYYTHVEYFLDAVVMGRYNPQMWRLDTPVVHEPWRNKLDFVAPQYYRRFDIHFFVPQAITAPFIGGKPITDVSTHAEAKTWSLYNDLGWPVSPNGLHDLLVEFHERYKLPIFITENGMGESRDRNRAAYVVAHLQQVLRAIQDGVRVIGYLHWTIADNWEWAYDYLPKARFGLFTIDRTEMPPPVGRGSFTRHITEGALALAYCIRNSQRVTATNSTTDPMDLPVRSFGGFTGDGKSVDAPTYGQGAWWGGWSQLPGPWPDSEFLVVHIGTLFDGSLFGFVHVSQKDLHFALEDVVWAPSPDDLEGGSTGAGTLTFAHQRAVGEPDRVTYSFQLAGRSGSGHQALVGTRIVQELEWQVTLLWDSADGPWASTDPDDEIVAVMPRQFAGDGRRIGPKYLRRGAGWEPQADPRYQTVLGGFVTEFGSSAVERFEAVVGGETLAADMIVPGAPPRRWNGTRLPDGIPF